MSVTLGERFGGYRLAGATPRRLAAWLAVLVGLAVAAGLFGGYRVDARSTVVDDITLRSGALATTELRLYQSLSDADATAATAFLAGGLEPPKLRDRYRRAIARASAALATAADGAPSSQNAAITTLSVNLPVYTGLVERARAYNRQGLPLGAAYLREASGLMRGTLLPAAEELYKDEARRLVRAQDEADDWLWFTVLLVLALLACLGFAQRELTRRTNRVLNRGLVAATAATVVALLWLAVASIGSAAHVGTSFRDGSAQLDRLAKARIMALQARSDEAMTLIARGGGGDFDKHYTDQIRRLLGAAGDGGLLSRTRGAATEEKVRATLRAAVKTARRWRAVHAEVRRLDDGGDYNKAVERTIGGADDSAGALAGRLDSQLATAIRYVSARFADEAGAARTALYGLGYGLVLLMTVTAVGAGYGLQQRIREYR